MASILAYSITLMAVLIFSKNLLLYHFNVRSFLQEASKLIDESIRSLGSFFYFLIFTILAGMDRLYIQDFADNQSVDFVTSYLFYLSIFVAFFGLCTFNFDQIRKMILDKKEVKYRNFILPVFLGFLSIAAVLCFLNVFFVDFLNILKIPQINLIEILFLSIFVFSIYVTMLVATSLIQAGSFFLPIVIGLFLVITKVIISFLYEPCLANIITSLFAIVFAIFLYNKSIITT
ncbi:hypothetical protein [Endozoicomonas sp. ISHI1]|uniref:hypothetical protein n=1 Tax=Endozoicomonas sp. ISHI1 TaxID=2825882 RepID=UPI00214989CA|nr:hypothetical protein [Endozoicomonas sp. ISHI1]